MKLLTKSIFGILVSIFMVPAMALDGVEVEITDDLFELSIQDVLVSLDGDVSLTFISQTAGHNSDLFLTGRTDSILNNHVATPGDVYNLGSFDAGTALEFNIVNNVTGYNYFSGLPSLNPDNTLHALFTVIDDDTVEIGFEDLFQGGDKDYDDVVFQVHNVALVPEPSTVALMLGGLLLLSRIRKRIK